MTKKEYVRSSMVSHGKIGKAVIFLFFFINCLVACAEESAESLYKRAKTAMDDGNYEVAIPALKKAASQRHLESIAALGFLHVKGVSGLIEPDLSKGFDLLLEAAKLEHPMAQWTVAGFYLDGHGTKKDLKAAAYWAKKSAKNGQCYAQLLLSKMYWQGVGIEKDHSEAVAWLYCAKQCNNPEAINAYNDLRNLESKGLSGDDYIDSVMVMAKGEQIGKEYLKRFGSSVIGNVKKEE